MMLENKLAEFVQSHDYQSISENDRHIIKRNILDAYAGICASLRDKEMLKKFNNLTAYSNEHNGIKVWGTNNNAPLDDALFMNCILGRRSDLVNTYMSPAKMGASHPSDNVSLVLTLAHHLQKNGKEMLSSTHLAYLLSCAFSDYYDPQAGQYDHDAQALMYIPLIIGKSMGFDNIQLAEVQRIAGVMGLSVNQSSYGMVSDWRHCTYASTAQRAMKSVWMVLAGFKGADDIYEGIAGINHFFKHARHMLDPLPDLDRVVFKRWPALVFCQTPIDAALDVAENSDSIEEIEKIEVLTYSLAKEIGAGVGAYQPNSRAGRTHSIPYCVAVALLKNTVKYEYFDDGFQEDHPEMVSLIQKINVEEDPAMTSRYPEGAACRIILHMNGGITAEVEREYPKGDPHDPLNDKELDEKAYPYIAARAGTKAEEIINRIWNIEKEKNLGWLIGPLLNNK